jgi:23S rRNA pseudouridine955/2504/2580 synthase/23S rRNA pseudouridine1911/1915/1917 synthase
MKKQFQIIYEDDDIVVVDKSPFLLTIPDRYAPEKLNLYTWLNDHYGKIYIVHRLDRETSGILVFAKNEEVHKHLSQQFEDRTVRKVYYVLVEGNVHQECGIIDKPLGPHPQHPDKMTVVKKGKPSVTEYRVAEHFKNYTLLEAEIKTGRTHQIRVHFQAIGYPLATDALYGRKAAFYLSDVKQQKYQIGKNKEERPLMHRTSLHAWKLTFQHPASGETVGFQAPLPKDFGAVVQQLRKWGK